MSHEEFIRGYKSFAPTTTKIIIREVTADSLDVSASRRISFSRSKRDITWVRESNTSLRVLHGGIELKDWGTYNDFYGFLTSCQDPIESTSDAIETYGVTETSTLEIAVFMWLTDTPTLGFSHEEYKRKLFRVINPKTWVYYGDDIADDADLNDDNEDVTLHRLKSVDHSYTKVWSSFRTKDENEKALADFKTLANADVRTLGDPYTDI